MTPLERMIVVVLSTCSRVDIFGRNPDALRLLARRFAVELGRAEFAQVLGTTPEAVSRSLAKFCVQGLIAVTGRRVRILNEERLRLSACRHGSLN